MDALTLATEHYLRCGATPARAEELARQYVAFLRTLVREAARQEQAEPRNPLQIGATPYEHD